ncbi:MAG TPA: hypothetical protein VGK85_07820, partial [Myxococcaceae bacterium]
MSICRAGGGLNWGWVCVLALALACGSGRGGGQADAGLHDPGLDGGVPEDGGPVGDAGLPGDAGTDAGIPSDGGPSPDGGVADAGVRMQVPPAGQQYHGVFPAGSTQPDADISMQAADDYVAAVGRPLAWIYFSNEWFVTKLFPQVTAEAIRARGAVPFIRLHMRSENRQKYVDPLYTLDNINAGMFDADLRAWADGAKQFGTAVVVQYGTEINGDWYP